MPLTPVRQTLPNGVVVIAQENHTTAAVSLVAAVSAGGYDDAANREGSAALLARVLDRGTASRTADQIADDLDGRGASVTVSAGRHQIAGVGHLPCGRLRPGAGDRRGHAARSRSFPSGISRHGAPS